MSGQSCRDRLVFSEYPEIWKTLASWFRWLLKVPEIPDLMMGVDILSRLPLLALILLSTFSAYVFALPIYHHNPIFDDGNVTPSKLNGLGTVWYRAESGGRGTVGILVSCTATYIFCVWTSLHPNILHGKGGLRRACYKVVLMMIAILVPEAIMLCAVGELLKAWKLKRDWENEVETLKKENASNDPNVEKTLKRLKDKLPLEAAFVVVMGGFLINKSKLTAWKEVKEGKFKEGSSNFLKSSFEALKRKAPGKSTKDRSVMGWEKIKDKGKSLEKSEKNSTTMPPDHEKSEINITPMPDLEKAEINSTPMPDHEKAEINSTTMPPDHEKGEINITPMPDLEKAKKWWQKAYVHKLVLTNKTAHYMPPHNTSSAHQCDDAVIKYPTIDPELVRPEHVRSPDSFLNCRVSWATGRRASSPLPGSNPVVEAVSGESGPLKTEATKTKPEETNNPKAPEHKHTVTKAETDDLEPGTYSTILTPEGLIHCLRHGQIDHNSFHKADMEDKGTSSTIAKFLACVQALWLVAQSFGRWQSNPQLPLTLLEVHVLLQVACAGLTYLCWWVKPLGVIEPVVVTLHHRADNKGKFPPEFKHYKEILELYDDSYKSRREGNEPPHFLTIRKSNRVWRSMWFTALLDVITRLTPAEPEKPWNPRRPTQPAESKPAEPKAEESKSTKGSESIIDKLTKHIPRMSSLMVAGFLVAGVGALHLVALGSDFSSRTEQQLWTASCAGLIAGPFAVLPVLHFTGYHEDVFRKIWEFPYQKDNIFSYTCKGIHDVCTTRGKWWVDSDDKYFVRGLWIMFHYILVVICLILLGAGLLSSFYLTVESYLAMRSPPAGTFQTPRWADFMPHI